MNWNWKTTLGGLIFICAAIVAQMDLVPQIIYDNAQIIGIIILSFFAKDKP